jgi:hypothetical protein
MHHYEITISTPGGCYHVVIAASSQHGAIAQANMMAQAQRGYVAGGSARQID